MAVGHDDGCKSVGEIPPASGRNDGIAHCRRQNPGVAGPGHGLDVVLDVPPVPKNRVGDTGGNQRVLGGFVVCADLESDVVGS